MAESPEAAENAEVHLPSDLGVAQAAELRNELLKFLSQGTDIGIKGGDAKRIHTASLQVIAAWLKDRVQNGHEWHWSALSPELRQAAESLGLTEVMGIKQDDDANAKDLKE